MHVCSWEEPQKVKLLENFCALKTSRCVFCKNTVKEETVVFFILLVSF